MRPGAASAEVIQVEIWPLNPPGTKVGGPGGKGGGRGRGRNVCRSVLRVKSLICNLATWWLPVAGGEGGGKWVGVGGCRASEGWLEGWPRGFRWGGVQGRERSFGLMWKREIVEEWYAGRHRIDWISKPIHIVQIDSTDGAGRMSWPRAPRWAEVERKIPNTSLFVARESIWYNIFSDLLHLYHRARGMLFDKRKPRRRIRRCLQCRHEGRRHSPDWKFAIRRAWENGLPFMWGDSFFSLSLFLFKAEDWI